MPCEQLSSIAEAISIARKAQRDGQYVPISPCIKLDPDGKLVTCPSVDPTLVKLCKEPEGVLVGQGGILVCPKQKGDLVLTASTNQEPTHKHLNTPQTPVRGSEKERKPYFVR